MGGPGWDTDFTLPDGTPVLRSTINADDPTRLIGNLPLDANAPMVPGYSVDRIRTLEAWASKDVYYSPIPFDPQMIAAQEGFRSLEIGQMNRLAAVEEASAYMAREFPNRPEIPSSAQLWASSVFQRPPVFDGSGRPIQYISAPDLAGEARAIEARQRSVNNIAMGLGGPFIGGPMAFARALGVNEAGVAQTGLQASAFLDLYAPRGGVTRTSDIASRRRTSVMRANDGPQLPFDRMMPNYGPQQPRVTGEANATAVGKEYHAQRAISRRASGDFDLVNQPFVDASGRPILVSKRVNLKTGQPQPLSGQQIARPDAVIFGQNLIIDDKPLGRPISKDQQEIMRFIRAYEASQGVSPRRIAIERYDPVTGQPVVTELYSPSDFPLGNGR